MRKIVWLLGAISLVGLAMTAGLAQERETPATKAAETEAPARRSGGLSFLTRPETTASRPAPRTLYREPDAGPAAASADALAQFQRYQRDRAIAQSASPQTGSTGLKNYQQALFGTPSGQAVPDQGSVGSNAPQRRLSGISTALAPNPAHQANPVHQANSEAAPAALPIFSAGGIQQAGGINSEPAGSEFQQAAFAEPTGAAGQIQQVSGTGPLAPRLPQPGFAATGEAQASEPELVLPVADREPLARPLAQSFNPNADSVPTNLTADSPHIQMRWTRNSDVNVGQPCDLTLTVKNDGRAAAHDVIIDAHFPPTVRLIKTQPEPTSASTFVRWQLPTLDAGEERDIAITLVPSRRGEIAANANVRFTAATTTVFSAEEPKLELQIAGPKEVTIGEPAPQLVTISNPGSGVAHNVIVEVVLPEGLEHPKGDRLKMELGSLNPGETRTVRLSLTAIAGGEQAVTINAASGTELRETSVSKLNVLAPSLKLAVDGPSRRYVGRDARYSLHVTNDGQAVTNNVRASYKIPSGFKFQSATHGGQFDEVSGVVNWFVGSLAAKQTTELQLRLKPVEPGDFEHQARVTSEHGGASDAVIETKIEGTASLLLEVVDLDDPVEIGRETVYEVRVSNEGSKEAQNVGLSLELPTHVELLNVKGPSQHITENGLIVFRALPMLEPGKTALFQIHVKGMEEGNQRVRARLTSDSIQEPLTVEELTRFYAD